MGGGGEFSWQGGLFSIKSYPQRGRGRFYGGGGGEIYFFTGTGSLPINPEVLREIQTFAKSVFNSCNLSSKQGCSNLYHLEVEAGGFIYIPSG